MDSGLSLALSIIIGSIFLVTVLTAQSNLHELKLENFLENIAQEKLEHTKSVLTWHIEKVGYNVKKEELPTGHSILFDADKDTTIKFYSDINLDGNPDLIELFSGNPFSLTSTKNPIDFSLYRKINNGTPELLADGLTFLNFDVDRERSADNNMVTISLIVQTPFPMNYRLRSDDVYFQREWQEVICPDNLGRY